jgi:phospholipid N-methyltransferase
MVRHVAWQNVQSVAELGPGTGIFTRYILIRKNADCQLLLFERDPDLRDRLAKVLPDV